MSRTPPPIVEVYLSYNGFIEVLHLVQKVRQWRIEKSGFIFIEMPNYAA